ncbi:MAG: phosphoribosylanthranilate isomerase, partial [Chthoniobacterales bacterium]
RVAPDFSLTNAYDCDAILLDTWSPDRPGGTGETFDWSIAAQLRDRVRRLILAGGLGPDNVSAAIRTVRPFAVDVCSGVEDAPGRKSDTKLRRFIAAVRASESVETAA